MTDGTLRRLAAENPVGELPPLPFDVIAARIDAADTSVATSRRPQSPPRRWRGPAASAVLATATLAVVLVVMVGLAARRPLAPAGRGGSVAPAPVTALAAHFAVLRTAADPTLPAGIARRVRGVLHEPVAEARRVAVARGTVWVAVGADGRLCVTLVTARGDESFAVACAGRAQAIRTGVRIAGRLDGSAGYVAGILPDRLHRASVRGPGDQRIRVRARDNVYTATVATD